MRNLYAELKRQLAQGFYPDNFLVVARLAEEASWQADRPLGLFVLSRILLSLGDDWSAEQGIETELAEEMKQTMQHPIAAYIADVAARTLTAQEEELHLNGIILSYLRWRSAHQ